MNPDGTLVYWNSTRSGDANYGFGTTPTTAILNLIGTNEGIFVFAIQVARQYHNVTVIVQKTSTSTTFEAYDQGTGWFDENGSIPLVMSVEELNEAFKDVHENRGGAGEIHSKILMYSSGRTKIEMKQMEKPKPKR
jgi:hypothetical protein